MLTSKCSNLIVLGIVLFINYVKCTEFVPVYMWDSSRTLGHIPSALHKISQENFKEDLLDRLKNDPYIVVFAEQTLSPEDFAQRDQSGRIAFPHLANLRDSKTVVYKPYVQNPLKALKHLDRDVVEVSIETFQNSAHTPKSKILIVDLNDAQDDEHRIEMLKRHDSLIEKIYNEITKKHEHVLALYTAHHTSWVASEDVSNRRTRSLLAAGDDEPTTNTATTLFDDKIYLYIKNVINTQNGTIYKLAKTESFKNETVVSATLEYDQDLKLILEFSNTTGGYWQMNSIRLDKQNVVINFASTVYAPIRFSYHCGNQSISTGDKDPISITLEGFQVQPNFKLTPPSNKTHRFDDAYDCVGFTSVPIWSGIFVTFILMFIMTFGLTMMMDIKTMDRFDDAKGKTITINVSE